MSTLPPQASTPLPVANTRCRDLKTDLIWINSYISHAAFKQTVAAVPACGRFSSVKQPDSLDAVVAAGRLSEIGASHGPPGDQQDQQVTNANGTVDGCDLLALLASWGPRP